MKTTLIISSRILVLLLMVLILSCNNQSNKKYNLCVQVLKEHIKTVENSVDCDKLEKYYNETGKAGGWGQCQFFLLLFHPDVPGFENSPGFMNWFWDEINDDKREKLQDLHDELKSTIEKTFIQLNCTSEAIRAYKAFYDELGTAVMKCSDYKDYNSLINNVTDCIKKGSVSGVSTDYMNSFTLRRFINALNNIKPEESSITESIEQDFASKTSELVAQFKAEERQELLIKELYENSTLRDKLHWLAREGAEKEWNELIDNNTIIFDVMIDDYNNPIKAEKKYVLGSDIILKIRVYKLKRTSGRYSYIVEDDIGTDEVEIYTNDESFAELDYPRTVWIIAKYSNRYRDSWLATNYYEFTDAELLAWSK